MRFSNAFSMRPVWYTSRRWRPACGHQSGQRLLATRTRPSRYGAAGGSHRRLRASEEVRDLHRRRLHWHRWSRQSCCSRSATTWTAH